MQERGENNVFSDPLIIVTAYSVPRCDRRQGKIRILGEFRSASFDGDISQDLTCI